MTAVTVTDSAGPDVRTPLPGAARTAVAGVAALLPLLALTAAADAQERLFPDRTLMPRLEADPRAPGTRGSFVLADRPDSDFPGTNVEAEVALGHVLPVLLLQPEEGGRPALALDLRVGVFSRFFMETPQRDLIAVDYRVDLPVTFRHRSWEGRIGYQHYSAHLADDFVRRFEPSLAQHSRDGVEAVVARRFPPAGLRLYAGGRLNFHANPGVHDAAAKGGVEWDPGRRARDGSGAWPFAAVDVEIRDTTDEAEVTGSAGVRLRVRGRELRLEARGHLGPGPMGQLGGTEERFVGLGLRIAF